MRVIISRNNLTAFDFTAILPELESFSTKKVQNCNDGSKWECASKL